eukprot:3952960-Pyramimonas_sp.AAC.1
MDVDPEDQRWPPQQLCFKTPARLLRRALCRVTAVRRVGHGGLAGRQRWRGHHGVLLQRGVVPTR